MVAIDLEKMISYPLNVKDEIGKMKRTAFGIASISRMDYIIIGGYNEYGNNIHEINPYYMVYQLNITNDLGVIIGSTVVSVTVFGIILLLAQRKLHQKKIRDLNERKDLELDIFNEAMKENFANRMTGLFNDLEFTATLNLPNDHALSVPLYKKAGIKLDVTEIRKLATGGFGTVYKGKFVIEIF
jgi:hypothetical protein